MESDSSTPKLSIITVVYNGVDLLEGTILSVKRHLHPDIEYIIIDGGSKDGTLGVLQTCHEYVDHWISEKDKGVYDAMNKGINMAKGQFIWFLNAGDNIASDEIMFKVLAAITPDVDVLYGEIMIVDDQRKRLGIRSELSTQKLPEKLNWESFKYGMTVSHQGFIARKSIVPKYRLDNLSADVEWCIECLKKSRKNLLVPGIFVNYLAGGMSKKQWKKSMKDRYKVLERHYGFIHNLWAHFVILLRSATHKLFRLRKKTY